MDGWTDGWMEEGGVGWGTGGWGWGGRSIYSSCHCDWTPLPVGGAPRPLMRRAPRSITRPTLRPPPLGSSAPLLHSLACARRVLFVVVAVVVVAVVPSSADRLLLIASIAVERVFFFMAPSCFVYRLFLDVRRGLDFGL